jgi:hypothetical protein
LIKTFFSGLGGWAETQHPDGTMTFRSPCGRAYATKPGGGLFFPQLATSTGRLAPPGEPPPPAAPKTLMMPTRKRTRAAERAARITWERGLNESRILANPPPF